MRTNAKLAGTTTPATEWSGADTYGEVVTTEAEHNGHKIVARSQQVTRDFGDKIADPARRVSTFTAGEVEVDGEWFGTLPAGTPAQVVKKIAAKLDTIDADAKIVGQLNRLIANDRDGLVTPEQVEVGQVASVHAMGHMRQGIVTRVTKTGAEVAYTTASSAGRVFRKVAKVAELLVEPAAQVEAPAVVEAAPVVVAAEAARPEVTATVEPAADTVVTLRRAVEAAEGDLVAATEAEGLAKAGTDKREAHLSSRRRRAAARRLARAQAALAAAQG